MQMFFNIGVLKNFAKSPKGLQLYKKETPTLAFSCEYGKIFTKTFFTENIRVIGSVSKWG